MAHFLALRRARWAVSALFLANGLAVGWWSVFVPVVRDNLGISESRLGLLILIGSSAGFVGLMLSSLLISRLGSARVSVAAGVLLAPALWMMSSAEGFVTAAALFVVFFLAMSLMDVAMNAHGALVEDGLQRAVMSSYHGFWSLGAMTGAASGGWILAEFGQRGLVFTALAAVLLLTGCAGPALLPEARSTASSLLRPRRLRLPPQARPVIIYGLFALAAFTAEGSVIDWSAIYLRASQSASLESSGLAFAGFSFSMMTARFLGDTLRERVGGMRLLQWSAAVAAVGFAMAAWAPGLVPVVAGFVLAGFGCANIVPLVFSAAARVPGLAPGSGIAIATLFGYFGLLCAPALLGYVGEVAGFAAVFAGFTVMMLLVGSSALVLARRSPIWLSR